MKKLVNKFKALDLSKRIVIIFITISFVFIGGLSFYNGITGNYQSQSIVQKDTIKQKNTKKTKKKKNSLQQNNDNKKEKSQNNANSKEDSKNQSISNSSKENSNDQSASKNTTFSSNVKNKEASVKQNTESSNTTQTNQTNNNNQSQNQITNNEKINVNVKIIGFENNMMMNKSMMFDKDTNAFNALKIAASQENIKIITKGIGIAVYVSGIGDLYEKQHGPNSGWMYKVNGTPPNYGAGGYKLKNGDNLVWYYVTDY